MLAQDENPIPPDTENALCKLITYYYLLGQEESNGDEIEQHCCGVVSAIKAIYQLGYSQGFTAGAQYVREQGEE